MLNKSSSESSFTSSLTSSKAKVASAGRGQGQGQASVKDESHFQLPQIIPVPKAPTDIHKSQSMPKLTSPSGRPFLSIKTGESAGCVALPSEVILCRHGYPLDWQHQVLTTVWWTHTLFTATVYWTQCLLVTFTANRWRISDRLSTKSGQVFSPANLIRVQL